MQIQAKIKKVNWKMYPKVDIFFIASLEKWSGNFENFVYLCSRV